MTMMLMMMMMYGDEDGGGDDDMTIPNPFPQSEPAQISSINLSSPIVWKTSHSQSLSANFKWQAPCDSEV